MGFRLRLVAAALAAGCAALTSPALADKPAWAGQGKGHASKARADRDAGGGHFDASRRAAVRGHYEREFHGGKCPPGLAKKRNGCMPPGQARKWQLGRPLATEVVVHELPPKLVIELGTPPVGYRYVRVASDILMIAAGTKMVVEAIKDLGRL